MRIAIIGAGYVGLTTGTCLADLGHDVTCIDMDAGRVANLQAGVLPIYEPGLGDLLLANCKADRLRFTDDIAAVGEAEAVFIAVGTPSLANGDIDLSFVESAAAQIAPVLKPNAVVVVKSTVVVGTSRMLREIIAEKRGALDFSVVSNPEFLREGTAVRDFLQPDRIVFGCDDPRARIVLERIYQPLADKGAPVFCTTSANAELIKYAANAFLALKIGFINDIANLCEQVGGDVEAVARGIGSDQRIGANFLAAGPGFGGSCFPKDTRALAATGRKNGAPQGLVETLIQRNDTRPQMLAERLLRDLDRKPDDTCIAVLGLAFKANTDDVRESPSLALIDHLRAAGCTIRAHDPCAMGPAGRLLDEVTFCDDALEAAAGADCVVVMTEWQDYRDLDLPALVKPMRGRLLADFRNLWTAADASAAGLDYVSIGRAAAGRSTRAPKMAVSAAGRATERQSATPAAAE